MPFDFKYGEVTLEKQRNIQDDEPVFVFRAQDRLTPMVLDYYRKLCVTEGSPAHHIDGIIQATREIVAWQDSNGSQIPQSKSLNEGNPA